MRITTSLAAAAASLASVAAAQHTAVADPQPQDVVRPSTDGELSPTREARLAAAIEIFVRGQCYCGPLHVGGGSAYSSCVESLLEAYPDFPAEYPRDERGQPITGCHGLSVPFAKRQSGSDDGEVDDGEVDAPRPIRIDDISDEEVDDEEVDTPRPIRIDDILLPPVISDEELEAVRNLHTSPSMPFVKRENVSDGGEVDDGEVDAPQPIRIDDISDEELEAVTNLRMSFYCPGVSSPELARHCRSKISAAFPEYPDDYPRDPRGLPADAAFLSDEGAGARKGSAQDDFNEALNRACEMERRMSVYCSGDVPTEECKTKMLELFPAFPEDYPRNRLGMRISGKVPEGLSLLCKWASGAKPEFNETDAVVRRALW